MYLSDNDSVVIAETCFCALFCVPYLIWPLNAAILLALKDQQLATSIFVMTFFSL